MPMLMRPGEMTTPGSLCALLKGGIFHSPELQLNGIAAPSKQLPSRPPLPNIWHFLTAHVTVCGTRIEEIGRPVQYILMYGDNNGSIFTAQNPNTGKGTKHVQIKYHHIREQIEEDNICLFRVDTDENHADMFTKNLDPQKFLYFRKNLGLEFYPEEDCVVS